MYFLFIRSLLMVFLLSSTAHAGKRSTTPESEWVFARGANYQNTHTVNIHALEFGITCNSKCMFYITPPLVCHKNTTVNGWLIEKTGVGSKITAKCLIHEGVGFLALENYKEIMRIAKTNSQIHFIINWGGERNSLMTFDMLGFKDSLNRFNPKSILDQ